LKKYLDKVMECAVWSYGASPASLRYAAEVSAPQKAGFSLENAVTRALTLIDDSNFLCRTGWTCWTALPRQGLFPVQHDFALPDVLDGLWNKPISLIP
jgi:hypothetical protein